MKYSTPLYLLLSLTGLSLFASSDPSTISISSSPLVISDCDLEVIIPSDMHLCNGEDYDLCATINTTYDEVEFEWSINGSPTNYNLCEIIDITEETTFSLSVIARTNLIENGD